MSDLEQYVLTLSDSEAALSAIQETRANLEKLVNKIDSLESGFDRIAERSRMFTRWLPLQDKLLISFSR
jgi:autophagy-related protein 11